MYTYNAVVVNCVDGDTFDAQIDLGFRIFVRDRFRLIGINTPEIRGADKLNGLTAKLRLKEIVEGKVVVLQSHKVEKYGRWLARIWLPGILESVNDLLVREGLAVPYMVEDLILNKEE